MVRKWQGIWIKAYDGYFNFKEMPPAPYFRKQFSVPTEIKNAVVHLCGLGFHELFVNGIKADDRWYAPALTQYDCRVKYIDYDVTDLLKPGEENTIVIHLGSGFYNCHNKWLFGVDFYSWRGTPRLRCDLEINGSTAVYSGVDWKIHPGPVVYDCFHEGEDYDARLEMPEIFLPGYDDSKWDNAKRTISPGGILELDTDEPCRILKRLKGVEISRPEKNVIIYDFQANIAGVVEFTVRGNAGDKINIQYCEMLTDGRADTSGINMGMERFESDSYILKGGEKEMWHPVFVWHGFRYVEITLSSPETEIISIDGLFIGSDFAERGKIETSSAVLNKVCEITLNSYRGNFMGIPTDCPTREKFGWGGDCTMAMETGWWNFSAQKGIQRLLDIHMDTQRPDGCITTHGPTTLWGFNENSPGASIFPMEFCRMSLMFDGNDSFIKQYYNGMKKIVGFWMELSADEHLTYLGYGDYCNPYFDDVETEIKGAAFKREPVMVESCEWYEILKLMTFFADMLGFKEDKKLFADEAELVKNAVNRKFYDPDSGLYDDGFWCSNALALNYRIVPDELREKTAAALVALVRNERHRAMVGFQGSRQILRALSENGYLDDALEMVIQPEHPGWGNLVARGATTLWEIWDGRASQNHIIRGGVPAWMFRFLAGIYPSAPGFKKMKIQPGFAKKIDSVNAQYQTPHGKLLVKWERKNDRIYCQFDIPGECEAEIIVPGRNMQSVSGSVNLEFSI